MKKALITILILGIVGAGVYGGYRHFFENKETESGRVSSTSEDAVYVDLVSTITGYGSGNGLIDRYGGEIEPQATLEVKLESERKVKECFVKEGDEVREGQRLFVYDTQEDEDKVAQAEIEIEKAEGEIEVSEKAIAQYEKEKAKASSDDQLTYTTNILTEQNSIKQNEYEIKSKQLEVAQLKEDIENATVTAEMGGIIQKISDPNKTDSSYGSSSDSAYITILAVGDFRVKGTANEQSINQGKIYEGMPVIVYSRVDDTMTWKGEVSEVKTDDKEDDSSGSMNYYYSSSDDSSSKYTFYVELENSDNLILGQHVYMEEDAGQNDKKDGLWLEEYYIMQEGDQAYVWMANTSNVIEKRAVTLGDYDEELMKYEITDGLQADDYIAYPTGLLEEGDPVIYNDYSTGADMSGMAGMSDGMPDDGEDYEEVPYYGDDEADMGAEMFGFEDGGSIDAPADYDEGVYDADEN